MSSLNNIGTKARYSNMYCTPRHITTSLQEWALVTKQKSASPLDLTLLTKPTGAKIPETQYLEQALMLSTQNSQDSPFATRNIATISCIHLWDMHFNQQSHMQAHAHKCTQEATATFLLLPDWLGWSKNGYMTWINDYPEHACVLAKFPADSMLLKPTKVWLGTPPQPQHKKNKFS